jgi:hypothetical protein
MLIFWSIFVSAAFGWRFWLRFRKERQRQLMVTWPKSKPHFEEDEPSFALRGTQNQSVRWNYLNDQYTFFTQGEKFSGNHLLPEEFHVGVREAEEVETNLRLAEEAGSLRVHYNPADPVQNYLAVGHTHLSWGRVVAYLILGVCIPLFLVYSYFFMATDPQTWWQTVTFLKPES